VARTVVAHRLIPAGYKKGELEGKNVNVLMPPPFNARHNGYLKAYQNTGCVRPCPLC
jgi:hypothetical protein